MGRVHEVLGSALQAFAQVGSERARDALRAQAQGVPLGTWKRRARARVAAVSAAASWPGGVLAPAAAAFDLAFVMRQAARACLGVGYIQGRRVEPQADLPLVLALWADAARATSVAASRATAVVGGRASAVTSAAATAFLARNALTRPGTAVRDLVYGRALTKLATTALATVGLGTLVPVLGAGIAAAGSVALLDGLVRAAEAYYDAEYVVFDGAEAPARPRS